MIQWKKIAGTVLGYFRIGLSGPRLKASGSNLLVRNPGDSADAEITASKANISGNDLVLNSDAASTGADWKYTFSRPSSGMSADKQFVPPAAYGTSGQFMRGNGDGTYSMADAGDTTLCDKVNQTDVAYGDSSPISMLTIGTGNFVPRVKVIVDEAFDGTTPTLSIGINGGSSSKYMATTDVDLTAVGSYEVEPDQAITGGSEDIEAYLSIGGSPSQGAARILFFYVDPADTP